MAIYLQANAARIGQAMQSIKKCSHKKIYKTQKDVMTGVLKGTFLALSRCIDAL